MFIFVVVVVVVVVLGFLLRSRMLTSPRSIVEAFLFCFGPSEALVTSTASVSHVVECSSRLSLVGLVFFLQLTAGTRFPRLELGFTGFYWVLLGFTGFYWVLPGFTGFWSRQNRLSSRPLNSSVFSILWFQNTIKILNKLLILLCPEATQRLLNIL